MERKPGAGKRGDGGGFRNGKLWLRRAQGMQASGRLGSQVAFLGVLYDEAILFDGRCRAAALFQESCQIQVSGGIVRPHLEEILPGRGRFFLPADAS